MKMTFHRGKIVDPGTVEAVNSAVAVADAPQPAAPAEVVAGVMEDADEAALKAQLAAIRAKKKATKEAEELKAKLEAQANVAKAANEASQAAAAQVAAQPAAQGSLTTTALEEVLITLDPAARTIASQSTALARPQDVSNGIVQGDFDESDDRLPRLQIVAGSGALSQKYTPGTVLLEDVVLFSAVDPSKPQPVFRFIPLGLIKAFRERLDQNDPDNKDVIPRIVHTKDEVLRLGGTTEWLNGEQPTWNPTATIPMLIEKPDGTEHAGFSLQAGPKYYCPAVFYASGTSYREVALKIYNTSKYQLVEVGKDGSTQRIIYKKFWTAKLTKVAAGSFTVFTFDVRVSEEITGPETRELCQRFLSSGKKIEVAE